MFAGTTARIVTVVCAAIGAAAFVGISLLSIAGGSEYLEFALAMILFVAFLVGSYWWIVFGPGRGL